MTSLPICPITWLDVADLYQASTVSFLAENIDGRGKANILSTPGGKDILHLEAGFDRSWGSDRQGAAKSVRSRNSC